MARNDKYNVTKTYHFPNAIVRVHFPDISDEEQERRYEEIKKAALALLLSKEEDSQSASGKE